MQTKCIKALLSGRIQGVFFRDSTRRQALQLGLGGYAKNLADGRVEVLACGEVGAVDQLIAWLQVGPRMAEVTDMQVETVDMIATEGFTIA